MPPGRGRPPHPRRKKRRPAWRSSASKQRQWAKRESRFGEQQAGTECERGCTQMRRSERRGPLHLTQTSRC
jgi:hypothetical protein